MLVISGPSNIERSQEGLLRPHEVDQETDQSDSHQVNNDIKMVKMIREAFNKKKNIFLLTFVNRRGGGSGASFVNKKNHSYNTLKLPKKCF